MIEIVKILFKVQDYICLALCVSRKLVLFSEHQTENIPATTTVNSESTTDSMSVWRDSNEVY